MGPLFGSVVAQTGVSAPSSNERAALVPPMPVRTHPGQTELTRMLLPREFYPPVPIAHQSDPSGFEGTESGGDIGLSCPTGAPAPLPPAERTYQSQRDEHRCERRGTGRNGRGIVLVDNDPD